MGYFQEVSDVRYYKLFNVLCTKWRWYVL